MITHPDTSLRQVCPHGNLLSRAHVRISITAKRLFQLVQLLRREVSPLTPLTLVLLIVFRIIGRDWIIGIFLLHLRFIQSRCCWDRKQRVKLAKCCLGKSSVCVSLSAFRATSIKPRIEREKEQRGHLKSDTFYNESEAPCHLKWTARSVHQVDCFCYFYRFSRISAIKSKWLAQ